MLMALTPLTVYGLDSCLALFSSGEQKALEVIRSEYWPQFEALIERSRFKTQFDHLKEKHFYESRIYRGNSDPNLSARALVDFMNGGRTHELRSWDYQRELKRNLENGFPMNEALAKTDSGIASRLRSAISRTSVWDYVKSQYEGTSAGVPTYMKSGSSIPFAVGEKALATAIRYGIGQLSYNKLSPASARVLVFEIDGRQAPAIPWIPDNELFVLSHVKGVAVVRTFVGFPKDRISLVVADYDWIAIERSPKGPLVISSVAASFGSDGSTVFTNARKLASVNDFETSLFGFRTAQAKLPTSISKFISEITALH